MSGNVYIDSFIAVACLFFAGLINAAETAIISASKSKLEELDAIKNIKASVILRLKERADNLSASVQISTTVIILFAAAIGGTDISFYLQPVINKFGYSFAQGVSSWIALFIAVFFTSGVALVISSLVPKSLGQKYSIQISLRTSAFMNVLVRTSRFPQLGLTTIANLLLKPFKDSTTFSEPQLSEEAIMTIIEKGTESGVIDQTEHDLIESIFQFTETTAKEIMIPRTSIVAINDNLDPDGILKIVTEDGYTRMPVYSGSLDNIIGVIYSKDVLSLIEHRHLIILHDILRPVFFVPESKSISELLREFQKKKIHLAVVVDEFGGTEGIITLEDILEEIVGEIHDEYDEDTKPFEVLDDGTFAVDGLLHVSDFNELMPFHIPESDDYDTIAGFITKIAGRIPEAGDTYIFRSLHITIVSVDERRIEKVHIKTIADENTPAIVSENISESKNE